MSQQPPLLRFPEQLEEQINGFSTEVSGLQKRVPTVHLKTLTDLNLTKGSKPLVHFIDRDKQQKYMVVFANNTVKIYDMKGNEKTVNIEDAAYLATNTPRDNLRVMTVADYTFVLNNTKQCSCPARSLLTILTIRVVCFMCAKGNMGAPIRFGLMAYLNAHGQAQMGMPLTRRSR